MTLTCTNVTLRQKPLRNDRISLYLDYYPAIRNPYTMKMSRREFLGIYIYAKPKNEQQRMFNQDMLNKAEAIRCIRVQSLINEEFGFQHRFTTQFIEEKTLYDKMVCEISWWLSLALFVKALRTPWTLADLDQNTAYAGIGYSIKKQYSGKAEVVLGCSHIYNAQGQGLRYKLSKVEHPQFDKKKNPYLNFEEAYKFGMDILALFQDAMEKLPQRVVVHKRTPFKNDEIKGITNALKQAGISEIDLITITQEYDLKFIAEKIMYGQFLEDGYPVDRGTCIKLSSRNALLWTHGVVPSIQSNRRYYQGGRCIPAPLKITKYYGHGDLETIAKEILGFTKMNWNSFNLYTKLPATIDTSNTLAQVGNLLRQYNGVTYDYRFFI